MLGAFVGHGVPALLCQRFFRHILGIFQSFIFHADILHKACIAPAVSGKEFFHFAYTLAGSQSESFTFRHHVQQFHSRIGISEVQLQSAGAFFVQDAVFIAFHYKTKDGSPGDGANAIGIAIEVGFDSEIGIEYPCDRTKRRCCFIFRSVNNDFISLVRT